MKHALSKSDFESVLTDAAVAFWEATGLPTTNIGVTHMVNLLQALQPKERIVIQTEHTLNGILWRASTHVEDAYIAHLDTDMLAAVWGRTRKVMATYMGEPAPIGVSTFASRVIAARLRHAYSQGTLARLVGCSRKTISFYELGKAKPDYPRTLRLCRILGVSFDYLESGEGEEEVFAEAREVAASIAGKGAMGFK